MSIIIFALGFVVGALAGATALYFWILRDRLYEANDWMQAFEHQKRQLEQSPTLHHSPRAVSRLTNRERNLPQ
jgi:hypothetical protein